MTQTTYHAGQIVPVSGQYAAVTSLYVKAREVTCVKGERFPPTRYNEIGYVLVDRTRH